MNLDDFRDIIKSIGLILIGIGLIMWFGYLFFKPTPTSEWQQNNQNGNDVPFIVEWSDG